VAGPAGLAQTINYAYDPATGRLTQMWSDQSNVQYSQDLLGRLQAVTVTQRNGNPLSNQERTEYSFDVAGNLTTITQKVGPPPNPTTVLVATLGYDGRNRLLSRRNQNGSGTTLSNFVYTRQLNGQIQTLTETVLQPGGTTTHSTTTSYGYDALGRLVHEQSTTQVLGTPPGPTTSYTTDYTLDLVGNRLHKLTTRGDGTVERVDGTFDARDRLRQEQFYTGGVLTKTVTLQYDANGALTSQTASTGDSLMQSWDVRGRLATATNVQGTTTMVGLYRYDPDGIRMREEVTTTGTTSTRDVRVLIVDHQSPTGYAEDVEERGPDGRVVVSYVYGSSLKPISMFRPGQAVGFYMADGHSDVRQVVDLGGVTVLAAYRYDPFGVTVAQATQPGFVNIVEYQGQRLDIVVNQYDFRARLYDPRTGAFTTIDPSPGVRSIPHTFHRYVYVHHDPLNFNDPNGRFEGLVGLLSGLNIQLYLRAQEFGAKVTPAIYLSTRVAFYAFISSTITLLVEQALFGKTDPFTRGVQEASFYTLVILLTVSEFLPSSPPGGMASSGNQYPDEILDFAERHGDKLSAAIGNRMRQIGVPANMIGMKGVPGVDEGPLVRYLRAQGGGNVRPPQYGVQQPGINVDYAVLDANFPDIATKSPTWATASLKDRVDAVVAHEFTEVTAPVSIGREAHNYAVQHAPNTTLNITERARQILREYAKALGF
jgi:RHS repeat-associated protein